MLTSINVEKYLMYSLLIYDWKIANLLASELKALLNLLQWKMLYSISLCKHPWWRNLEYILLQMENRQEFSPLYAADDYHKF